MNKITIDEALNFAEENFPKAPEKLVKFLGIEVKKSPINTDGWCLQRDNRTIIRINSLTSPVRQRFTLAHELGHLIYGVTAIADENISLFEIKSDEEKKIDKFASELLLPTAIVLKTINEIPVTAKVLQKFAKKANVSQLAVALRVASLAKEIGLNNASVVLYENDEIKWQWSETLRLNGDTPIKILSECVKVSPYPARIQYRENEVIVASFIENPSFKTKVLFLQLVNGSDGFKQLREERIKELEQEIFQNNKKFGQILNGKFGAFKPKAEKLDFENTIRLFNDNLFNSKYPSTLNSEQLDLLKSVKGQEYIRLKLKY